MLQALSCRGSATGSPFRDFAALPLGLCVSVSDFALSIYPSAQRAFNFFRSGYSGFSRFFAFSLNRGVSARVRRLY